MTTQDRAPAFPFYAKDWLADPKVRALSYDHRGRYIDLLCSMWEHGEEGCWIPRSMAEKLYGKAFVTAIVGAPSFILDVTEREDSEWLYSNRLFQEAQKCQSRSEAAKRSRSYGKGGENERR